MKKIFAIVMAMIMMLSMVAMAAGDGSITITPPTGIDATVESTYLIYKVFDAVGDGEGKDGKISYKLVSGKTTAPEGFDVDDAGNVTYDGEELTDEVIEAIAEYVKNDTPVATVKTKGTATGVAEGLEDGYYYITTTTGSVVSIDSTNHDVTVGDKNTIPTIDKVIKSASSVDEDGKKALAQVGTTVVFEATIEVGKGAIDYKFHDKMSDGLSYKGDVAVTGINAEQFEVLATPETGDTFTIKFDDGIAEETKIVITYSAVITDAEAVSNAAETNTAYVTYGKDSAYKTTESTVQVYNAKFTVTKQDGKEEPLAGAGFVIMNSENKYYKLVDGAVTWVESIDAADEHVSDDQGAVAPFTGLANGTYTLVEKTVPTGYNKATDYGFTVAEHDYTAANLEQSTVVANYAGTQLPSTGGIGTTIFYVVGGLMMAAAIVLLVTKKKVAASK